MSAQTTGEPEVIACSDCGGVIDNGDERWHSITHNETTHVSERACMESLGQRLATAIAQRDAAARERTECVAREKRWLARLGACYRVVEAAESFCSCQGTASEGEKYAALNNALDAYCATCIEQFFASHRPSVDDDYGPNDGYARTVKRPPPQDTTPPQEATNDDA